MPSTGIFEVDVANPLFKEAEERGINWLRKLYGWGSVLDTRSKRVYYDCEVHLGNTPVHRLDFKADGYFHKTGCVGWEYRTRLLAGGETPGWGVKELDYIMYVSPKTWEAIIVDARVMRALGEFEYSCGDMVAPLCKKWSKLHDYGATDGLAIPLQLLEERGAIVARAQL